MQYVSLAKRWDFIIAPKEDASCIGMTKQSVFHPMKVRYLSISNHITGASVMEMLKVCSLPFSFCYILHSH